MRGSLLVTALLLLPLHACTTDAGGDTDTDTDGGSSSSSSSGTPTASGPTDASSSSTTEADASSSGSSTGGGDSSSSGAADESSTGETLEDICYGYTLLGMASEVSSDGSAVGEPMCSTKPASCRGDVTGTWTVEASCGYEALPNFFAEECPGATQQITGSNSTGTRTFEDDGTYTFDVVLQLDADLQVDSMACLGLGCEAFGEGVSEEPGLEMVCADGEGTSCDCVYTFDIPTSETGEWDIFSDALLLTSDAGEVSLLEYCVADGRLTTWLPLFEGTAFPEASCSEDGDCEAQVEGDFDAVGCEPPEEDER